jgi:hypothetical protein
LIYEIIIENKAKHLSYIYIFKLQIKIPAANGKVYSLTFDASKHNPYQVSDHFCHEQQIELGLQSETHIQEGCIPVVAKYIEQQLQSVGFQTNSLPPVEPTAQSV